MDIDYLMKYIVCCLLPSFQYFLILDPLCVSWRRRYLSSNNFHSYNASANIGTGENQESEVHGCCFSPVL